MSRPGRMRHPGPLALGHHVGLPQDRRAAQARQPAERPGGHLEANLLAGRYHHGARPTNHGDQPT
eukprot:5178409-Prorocentrum_lima.AAC.1